MPSACRTCNHVRPGWRHGSRHPLQAGPPVALTDPYYLEPPSLALTHPMEARFQIRRPLTPSRTAWFWNLGGDRSNETSPWDWRNARNLLGMTTAVGGGISATSPPATSPWCSRQQPLRDTCRVASIVMVIFFHFDLDMIGMLAATIAGSSSPSSRIGAGTTPAQTTDPNAYLHADSQLRKRRGSDAPKRKRHRRTPRRPQREPPRLWRNQKRRPRQLALSCALRVDPPCVACSSLRSVSYDGSARCARTQSVCQPRPRISED